MKDNSVVQLLFLMIKLLSVRPMVKRHIFMKKNPMEIGSFQTLYPAITVLSVLREK